MKYGQVLTLSILLAAAGTIGYWIGTGDARPVAAALAAVLLTVVVLAAAASRPTKRS